MGDISREEIDAKISASEARLETKLVSIEGKIDRLFDRVEVSVTASKDAKSAADDARKAATTTKWNILFTALGSLALVIAVWALWSQAFEMVSALLSAKPKP